MKSKMSLKTRLKRLSKKDSNLINDEIKDILNSDYTEKEILKYFESIVDLDFLPLLNQNSLRIMIKEFIKYYNNNYLSKIISQEVLSDEDYERIIDYSEFTKNLNLTKKLFSIKKMPFYLEKKLFINSLNYLQMYEIELIITSKYIRYYDEEMKKTLYETFINTQPSIIFHTFKYVGFNSEVKEHIYNMLCDRKVSEYIKSALYNIEFDKEHYSNLIIKLLETGEFYLYDDIELVVADKLNLKAQNALIDYYISKDDAVYYLISKMKPKSNNIIKKVINYLINKNNINYIYSLASTYNAKEYEEAFLKTSNKLIIFYYILGSNRFDLVEKIYGSFENFICVADNKTLKLIDNNYNIEYITNLYEGWEKGNKSYNFVDEKTKEHSKKID